MSNALRSNIEVQGTTISMLSSPGGDFISLTDMVRNFDGAGALIEPWLKNKDTVLFLGVWERLNNPRRSTPPATPSATASSASPPTAPTSSPSSRPRAGSMEEELKP